MAPATPPAHRPRLIDRFTTGGRARYRGWQLFGFGRPFQVRLRSGEVIRLRASGTDWSVAKEVFADEVYQLPAELRDVPIRRIVDIGGNVGYTTLYWLRRMPEARVLAFEPHPENVAAFRRHLELNRVGDRVELLPVAAGAREAKVTLWDCGSGSSMILERAGGAGRSVDVPMVDWVSRIGAEPIDLLKIDIEGGEYDLLEDPRFGSLGARVVVLEWHTIPGRPDGGRWCLERLREVGYRAWQTEAAPEGNIGMVWAVRP